MRLIIAFGVLLLISAIKAEDLQCYVCTDCETGYENFNATCSDSGSGEESGSGDGGESGSGSGGESGSGSGGESGSGSGGESGSGSGEESGSGSGGESGSGSGGESGSGSDEQFDNEEEIKYGSINVRVADNDENSNRKRGKSFDNTDYYSVEMVDKTVSQKGLIRFARSTRENDAVQAKCVVTSYEENNTTKIKRGCSYDSGNDIQKCQRLIADDYTGTPSRCSVCDENLCNAAYKSYGAYHIQFAFIALIIGVFFNT